MCCMRFTMSPSYRKAVEHQLKTAQHLGNLRQVKYCLAILAVMDGQSLAHVALVLRVHAKTVAAWVGGPRALTLVVGFMLVSLAGPGQVPRRLAGHPYPRPWLR